MVLNKQISQSWYYYNIPLQLIVSSWKLNSTKFEAYKKIKECFSHCYTNLHNLFFLNRFWIAYKIPIQTNHKTAYRTSHLFTRKVIVT